MAKIDDSVKKEVPELRFKGFTDEWEERKLSSIANVLLERIKIMIDSSSYYISTRWFSGSKNDYFNKQVASRDVTGYFLVKNGEFAYNKSYSNGYPWGAIKRLDKYEMGVLSTLYIVFKPTAINSQFLVSYYETTRWYREVSKNAAEGARNHGLLNISPNDFFNTLLTIPKSAEEQQQIGSFFKQLDDTITLHQRKLDLLKEQKKGFLQKMFPKNSAKVPELRFAGFADDWEERKLSDIADKAVDNRGKTPTISEDESSVIRGCKSRKRCSRLFQVLILAMRPLMTEFAAYIKEGDICVFYCGKYWFGLALMDTQMKNATIAQNIVAFRANEKYDSKFLYANVIKEGESSNKAHVCDGAVQPSIKVSQLVDVDYCVTENMEEQRKLGEYFLNLDNLITLHQRKLDLLKEQKKGFLQKMFV
uniref:Restriction modification system specificity subunit n=1 Tax=Streptococcus thermophilus TaxID=1308 RepID=Q9RNW6_STRTR|nr:restriction modification system specificity subunit [Streptococcus thermophilus]